MPRRYGKRHSKHKKFKTYFDDENKVFKDKEKRDDPIKEEDLKEESLNRQIPNSIKRITKLEKEIEWERKRMEEKKERKRRGEHLPKHSKPFNKNNTSKKKGATESLKKNTLGEKMKKRGEKVVKTEEKIANKTGKRKVTERGEMEENLIKIQKKKKGKREKEGEEWKVLQDKIEFGEFAQAPPDLRQFTSKLETKKNKAKANKEGEEKKEKEKKESEETRLKAVSSYRMLKLRKKELWQNFKARKQHQSTQEKLKNEMRTTF